ncbi:MAG TPA: hypothetical protein DEP53_01290 [Bacteroidetes bacterium]|nr:hypothetical protein [Bacteroidota bacterium]
MIAPFKIDTLTEPRLRFAHNQAVEDPRDGLSLFGPFDRGKVSSFSVGIVGTPEGIRRCKNWLHKISKPVFHPTRDIAKPFFPGFEEVFGVTINLNSIPEVPVDETLLKLFYRYDDAHVRVSEIVDLYISRMLEYVNEGERIPRLWFVVIPDIVYTLCRPKSLIVGDDLIHVGIADPQMRMYEGFFENDDYRRWRNAYKYENHFHNQLKIKLLKHRLLTQIVREATIAYQEYPNLTERQRTTRQAFETAIAWNLCTAMYYKIGGLPWKLGDIRKDVCYVGMSFKQDRTNVNPKYACCAAQMFLDSGDGTVFRGRVGPYYNPETKEYHLTRERARELLSKVLQSFEKENEEKTPRQVFLHGKTYFSDDEWEGFEDAVDKKAQLIGVRIRHEKIFKLFRSEGYPILRGSMYIKGKRTAYLWTKGFIPRLQSILGLETPNPLSVQVIRGDEDVKIVCKDILALTKLNYNSCIFCDGSPVTLKFADAIGEILTAGPNEKLEILPFMYYI